MLEAAECALDVIAVPNLPKSIGDADALIIRSKTGADAIANAPRLRAMVRHGVGLDFVPMEAAAARAIPVANVPGANAQAVAEYAFAAIFSLTRHVREANDVLRKDGWTRARGLSAGAVELAGKILGIVGVGTIGTKIAQIGASGFGMNVIGHRRNLDALPAFVQGASIEDIFARSDFVVLSCALTPQTEGMVTAALLSRMKPSAFLINVARGQLIDDVALATALRGGIIGGAALDVFSQQPMTDDHPFRQLDNVLLTPHLASLTRESMELTSRIACEELLRIFRGERPHNLANPEVWDAARTRAMALDVNR